MSPDELGQTAYHAYGASTGHRNHRGEPMPCWDDLGPAIQTAWTVATAQVRLTVLAEIAAHPADVHVHVHIPGLADLAAQIAEIRETQMNEVDAIAAVDAKVDDLAGDVRALLALLESERANLSPEGAAALDALSTKIVGLNTEVGDRDGSETGE